MRVDLICRYWSNPPLHPIPKTLRVTAGNPVERTISLDYRKSDHLHQPRFSGRTAEYINLVKEDISIPYVPSTSTPAGGTEPKTSSGTVVFLAHGSVCEQTVPSEFQICRGAKVFQEVYLVVKAMSSECLQLGCRAHT